MRCSYATPITSGTGILALSMGTVPHFIAVANAYAMSMRPLLRVLPDEEFAAVKPVAPPDIAAKCEVQRARANAIVQLILHPVAIPRLADAVAFSVTDSLEQRRILAQQYADTVREIADHRATTELHGALHPTCRPASISSPATPRSTPRSPRRRECAAWSEVCGR